MNDDEFAGMVGTALRERFPLPDNVDLLARLNASAPRRSRFRPTLAIAATVLVVAAVAIVLAVRGTTNHDRTASTYGLDGITWQGDEPILTLVFTGNAVRIFDGCSNELRQVTIGDSWLRIGEPIAPSGVCSGIVHLPGEPPSPVDKFDQVVYSRGELTWQRVGGTLTLTNAAGDAVELHASGSALSVTGQNWGLSRYVDAREYSQAGNVAATLRIDQSGTVYATDLCRDLTGTAIVTDTEIAFADMRVGGGACPDQASAATADVVDHVLSGTVAYAIRGDELIVYGKDNGLLIYIPAS